MYTIVAENIKSMEGEKNFVEVNTISEVCEYVEAIRKNLSTIEKISGARVKIFFKNFSRYTIEFKNDIPTWKRVRYNI